jgi:hypothetical protein
MLEDPALRDVRRDRKETPSQKKQEDMFTSPVGLGPDSDSADKAR